MDELWAAANDRNAGESSGDRISCSYGHDREAMDEDEVISKAGEHEEEEEDDDRHRPAKRLRGKQPLARLQQSMLRANSPSSQSEETAAEGGSQNRADGHTATHSSGDPGGLGRVQASDNDHANEEDEDEEEDEDDDNRNEVIEIFSDEEEDEEEDQYDEGYLLGSSSTSTLKRELILRSTPSPAADLARGLAASANACTASGGAACGIIPQDTSTTSSPGRWWETGLGVGWGDVGDSRIDAAPRADDSSIKERKFGGATIRHHRIGRATSEITMARAGSPAVDSGSKVNGKMSPEELAAEEGLARVGSSLAVPMISPEVGVESAVSYNTITSCDIRGTIVSSSCTATGAGVTKEFPRNLECAICFDPIAVVALFACGHGACWECAHEWCSRGTTDTMDCPTCHVSVPRNDFRRCIILDQVVELEVKAASMSGAKWEARLERGQGLARAAEAQRRNERDAQRNAEETIAEQAAELERLREEARSRSASRKSRRGYDRGSTAIGDYKRFMGMSDQDGLMVPESQRNAMKQLAQSIRHRRIDADHVTSAARGGSSHAAINPLGMSDPPIFLAGGARPRPLMGLEQSSPALGGSGVAEPWFSLRSHRSGRSMSGLGAAAGACGGMGGQGDGFGMRRSIGSHTFSTQPLDRNENPIQTNAQDRDASNFRPVHLSVGRPHVGQIFSLNAAGSPQLPLNNSAAAASGLPTYYASSRLNQARASPPPARCPTSEPGAHGARNKSGPTLPADPFLMPPRRTAHASRAATVSLAAGGSRSPSAAVAASASGSGASDGSMRFDDAENLVLRGQLAVNNAGQGKGAAAGVEEGDSDLDPLDVISHHEAFENGSEWDDFLAAVSLPQHRVGGSGTGLCRVASPGTKAARIG